MTDSKIAYLNLSVTQNGENPPNIKCESSGTFEGYFYAAKHLLDQFSTRHGMLAAVRNWAIESGYFELRQDVERALQSDIAAHHDVAENLPQMPPDVMLDAKMWHSSGDVQLNFVGVGDTEILTDFFRLAVFDYRLQRYTLLAAASFIEDRDPILWRPLANNIRSFVANDLLGDFEADSKSAEIKINEII